MSRLINSCAWVECLNAIFTKVRVEIWLNQSQMPMWVAGRGVKALSWLTHYPDLFYFQGLHHKSGVKVCSGPGYSCYGCEKGTLGTLCTLWSYWWVSLLDIWAALFHNETSWSYFPLSCICYHYLKQKKVKIRLVLKIINQEKKRKPQFLDIHLHEQNCFYLRVPTLSKLIL